MTRHLPQSGPGSRHRSDERPARNLYTHLPWPHRWLLKRRVLPDCTASDAHASAQNTGPTYAREYPRDGATEASQRLLTLRAAAATRGLPQARSRITRRQLRTSPRPWLCAWVVTPPVGQRRHHLVSSGSGIDEFGHHSGACGGSIIETDTDTDTDSFRLAQTRARGRAALRLTITMGSLRQEPVLSGPRKAFAARGGRF